MALHVMALEAQHSFFGAWAFRVSEIIIARRPPILRPLSLIKSDDIGYDQIRLIRNRDKLTTPLHTLSVRLER